MLDEANVRIVKINVQRRAGYGSSAQDIVVRQMDIRKDGSFDIVGATGELDQRVRLKGHDIPVRAGQISCAHGALAVTDRRAGSTR